MEAVGNQKKKKHRDQKCENFLSEGEKNREVLYVCIYRNGLLSCDSLFLRNSEQFKNGRGKNRINDVLTVHKKSQVYRDLFIEERNTDISIGIRIDNPKQN